MQLKGTTALVTASARRIGRAIAQTLARDGCDIVVHYHTSQTDAIELASQLGKMGRNAMPIFADLRDPNQIADMFGVIKDTFGRLDILVNNASLYYPTPLERLSPAQLEDMFAVNAIAPALCIKHAAALMENSGAIINIIDAKLNRPDYLAYCASKAALTGLTKSASASLAPRNIRVNAICPGVILWNENTPDDVRRQLLAQIPMKRTGTPQDIAEAVAFLAKQDYITGQTLNVDGGWNM